MCALYQVRHVGRYSIVTGRRGLPLAAKRIIFHLHECAEASIFYNFRLRFVLYLDNCSHIKSKHLIVIIRYFAPAVLMPSL